MAEIAKIARNCMKECINVRESITIDFLSSSTFILIPNMLTLAQNWLK